MTRNLAKRKLLPNETAHIADLRMRIQGCPSGVLVRQTRAPRARPYATRRSSKKVIEELKDRFQPEQDPLKLIFRALGNGALWSGQ